MMEYSHSTKSYNVSVPSFPGTTTSQAPKSSIYMNHRSYLTLSYDCNHSRSSTDPSCMPTSWKSCCLLLAASSRLNYRRTIASIVHPSCQEKVGLGFKLELNGSLLLNRVLGCIISSRYYLCVLVKCCFVKAIFAL